MLDYSTGVTCNDVVVITHKRQSAITAITAANLANITYRQLDYWARRGWVTPSVQAGFGRPGRRLYAEGDVIKLAALGHFGRSGVDVGVLGPKISRLDLADTTADSVLVATGGDVVTVPASELRALLAKPGIYCVYDPVGLRATMQSAGWNDERGSAVRSA